MTAAWDEPLVSAPVALETRTAPVGTVHRASSRVANPATGEEPAG